MSQDNRRGLIGTVLASTAIFLALAPAPLHAQDTRTVTEPKVPPACVTLRAALTTESATSGEIEARADRAGSDLGLLDTARIQQALDQCGKGHAVELAAGDPSPGANPAGHADAFLTGPIALRAGVTLLVDKGVTLYATRNPEYYAVAPGSCGLVNDDSASGCRALISVNRASGSAIMGEGAIDGQGGAALIFSGQAGGGQPGRPVAKSWWDLAEDARSAGRQQVPRLIDTDLTDDFTLYRITLKNSPNFHLSFHRGDGLTVWAVKIDAPRTARNTDGIDPAQAKNITITQSFIRTGDDNVAIKAGDGPASNITIAHNHFYWGHGISIGSETNGGVSQVRVEDLSLDGPDNGIRIKSNPTRGGLVENVVYDDVCIRNAKYPVIFDTTYSFPGKAVPMVPVYREITLRNVRISGGGKIQFNGFDDSHRIGVTLDGVLLLDGAERYKPQAIHTDFSLGPGPVNLILTGDDSTVTGKPAGAALPSCASKFVPFP